MAFTVRPSEAETEIIQTATNKLGVKSMSKGVIMACGEMLNLQEQQKKLERELRLANQRAVKAESAIAAYQKSQSDLLSFNPEKN